MREAGFSRDDIATIQRDNETACLLFGATVRSSGRSFLCHTAGTASAALAEGANLDIVRTAFLHAAYKHGRFPDGTRGKTEKHRRWLRDRTGETVESLIFRFGAYPFGVPVVREIVSRGDLEGQDSDMLLLKLANDVDDTYDFGALLGHKSRYRNPHYLDDLETLSRMAGFPICAEFFARAKQEMEDDGWLDDATEYNRRPFKRPPIVEMWRQLNGKT